MAKASSPIRLKRGLMEAATVAGSVQHRSASEQIEYWADIGRRVSKVVDTDSLLAVNAGLADIRIEEKESVSIDPDLVFAALERDKDSGALSEAIAAGSVRYQASEEKPGMLEQVHPDGRRVVGQFIEGEFQASNA